MNLLIRAKFFCIQIVWQIVSHLLVIMLVFDLGFAETPDRHKPRAGFLSVQLENDLWGSGKDRHYTHGTKISVMPATGAYEWLQNSLSLVPFFIQRDETALEFSFGQNLFTPDDIEREELIEYDRPFAGWLYSSIAALSMIEDCGSFRSGNTLEISLGIVGPSSQAEDVQRVVHEIVNTRKPRGWDNQLSDEPGFVLTYTRFWEHIFASKNSQNEYSFTPQAVAAIGNIYTYLGTGIMLRLGKNLRSDFSPPTISPSFQGTSYFNRSTNYSWYIFSGLEGRWVARNIFLDGNTFSDSHSVDRNPLVGDFQIGVAIRYKNIRISVSDIFRSKEFRGQDAISEYGAINITMMY